MFFNSYLAMYYDQSRFFGLSYSVMRNINIAIACTVSALIYQLFFTPDVGTWLRVELCQTDRSMSVLLTTKVMTVYCIGTVRRKQVFIFFNFEMNKSTTAEKIKINFSKFQFFSPFLEIFGGDLVKQLNKFVWPNQTYILIHGN